MSKILYQLESIGLNEKQAKTYIALVELGETTAYKIAKRSGIKRPTTYVILEELRKMGLVLKVPYAKNQIFKAKEMAEFFAQQEEKILQARRVLPELLALAHKNTTTQTLLYEGAIGIKDALAYKRDHVANKEMLSFYAKTSENTIRIPEYYFEHNDLLFRQHTTVRAIAPEDDSLRQFRKTDVRRNRKVKMFPTSIFSPRTSVDIADTFVRILLHKDKQALVIENKDFADFMKQVFEIIWLKEK